MMVRPMVRRCPWISLAAVCMLFAPPGMAKEPPPPVADTVYLGGNVVTMDAAQPRVRAVAVKGGKILAVGSDAKVREHVGPGTKTVRLDGATVLPGFIDPHSHFLGYAFFTDEKHWLDVSSVNLFFKPLPGDPRCKTPDDPQRCFIPVKSQDDVIERITAAARKKGATRVLAMSYDPARLGHGKSCKGPKTNLGFACPNFEDGNARATLDAISTKIPIFVSSQSGHVSYVNTPALKLLRICGVAGITTDCLSPSINPKQELALAKTGQLNEDLALYADSFWVSQVLEDDKLSAATSLAKAIDIYAGHGYTLIQEGAASLGDARLYLDLMKDPGFPFTVGLMMYDNSSPNFANTINMAKQAAAAIKGQSKIFIAGVKSFADGSPQGYTAFLNDPYYMVFPPFTGSPFPKPYQGLPDLWEGQMERRILAAHQAGYPIMIHENGDQAADKAVAALRRVHYPDGWKFRDIVLHAPFVSKQTMSWMKSINAPVSFLMGNLYFWGLPQCQQVLGPKVMNGKYYPYPARSALNSGLRVTMHTDSPVEPPSPLFSVWVAKTRKAQQPDWYPNTDKAACPAVMGPQESISIEQGLRAWTVDAAWQYGLSQSRGTLTAGKVADMVVMSDDPLQMEAAPDRLRDIRILATVHGGKHRPNPRALEKPIWPADY